MEIKIASFSSTKRSNSLMLPRIVLIDIFGYFGKKDTRCDHTSRGRTSSWTANREVLSRANPHNICRFKPRCIDDLWRVRGNLYDDRLKRENIAMRKTRSMFLRKRAPKCRSSYDHLSSSR